MKSTKVSTLVRLALLSAIIVIMAFTPLGFLNVGPFAITFITIPVIIGAITMGPTAGLFLGGMFGLMSFIQCFQGSLLGSVLLTINPFLTFFNCMVPRLLMGWLCGLLYRALNRSGKDSIAAVGTASLSGALMNTLFFMTSFILCFGNTEYVQNMQGGMNVFAFLVGMVGINGVVEAVSCAVIGTAVSKPLLKFIKKG
ncbi:MAG TPA: ECF transporter S component [Candidatus Aphodoplasma excrementigallinarum]|uniref:ECF transporter S component n=1 Tax=Candidatus Aphodoplasma excrementigallinarum TaxID=2840673 RepID=A0A9D1T0D4_9FIRM|nr:ECF transporter S component [Candidatus Aphodoplasma excrementigallinarum]